jgi:hypothetical protein
VVERVVQARRPLCGWLEAYEFHLHTLYSSTETTASGR